MRIIVSASLALALGSALFAQGAPGRGDRAWDDGPAWRRAPYAAPVDNRRPAFAAHVGPTGQGVD